MSSKQGGAYGLHDSLVGHTGGYYSSAGFINSRRVTFEQTLCESCFASFHRVFVSADRRRGNANRVDVLFQKEEGRIAAVPACRFSRKDLTKQGYKL
jgi:hypothetical protein